MNMRARKINIRHVASHYYIPIIVSGETERLEYIKHVIQIPSEISFLNNLEAYLEKAANRFKQFDWWMFSRLDEGLDNVSMPYYDGTANKLREFNPDFIFWMQKGVEYFIVFIDPKGTEHTDYQRKVDGYETLFEETPGIPREIQYAEKRVKVFAFLYTKDIDGLPKKYKRYWFDDIDKALASLVTAASVV